MGTGVLLKARAPMQALLLRYGVGSHHAGEQVGIQQVLDNQQVSVQSKSFLEGSRQPPPSHSKPRRHKSLEPHALQRAKLDTKVPESQGESGQA
jgi:hypothetical protein